MKPPFFSHTGLKPQIKICGLKTVADAHAAVQAGADALGFNFYPSSKRFVRLENVLDIVANLPYKVARIAVVVNPMSRDVEALLKSNAFDAIQFHGNEPSKFCRNTGFPLWIKAIRISNFEQARTKIASFSTPYILLDADVGNAYGGTGRLIHLSTAARIVQAFPDKHFLLAGGLCPENVHQAVQIVCPFALDVASGVENEFGDKVASKMRTFIEAARESQQLPPGSLLAQ